MKNIICCMHLSWEYVPKLFALSLFDMAQYAAGKYHLGMVTNGGCYSGKARDILTKKVIKYKPDYIFWLDADQTYPANTPEILMKHVDDGRLIVGGATPINKASDPAIDGKLSIWEMAPSSWQCRHRDVSANQGVIKVDAIGLGGIMMSPGVFKTMEYPWFRTTWDSTIGDEQAMDFHFYDNCRRAGIDVWCDTNLIYGHIGVRLINAT